MLTQYRRAEDDDRYGRMAIGLGIIASVLLAASYLVPDPYVMYGVWLPVLSFVFYVGGLGMLFVGISVGRTPEDDRSTVEITGDGDE